MKPLNTPVLFLVFNRPNTTKRVFDVIRQVKPSQLYIAADGPREGNENDERNCMLVKEIFRDIDWDCHVQTLYREKNYGCKLAVSSAITWFFEQVEEGIILEDDILPDPSFFEFCSDLLEHYRDNEKVMHISGFNICGTWKEQLQSYHFSYFGSIWGWASWKRAWKYYDVNIIAWKDPIVQDFVLKNYFPKNLRKIRKNLYDDLSDRKINTWDYQWTLCRLIKGGISIIPSKNLIENIGFDVNGTHTSTRPFWMPVGKHCQSFPLKYIDDLRVDFIYDKTHNSYSRNKRQNLKSHWIEKVLRMYIK